jgi:hypothetical protein
MVERTRIREKNAYLESGAGRKVHRVKRSHKEQRLQCQAGSKESSGQRAERQWDPKWHTTKSGQKGEQRLLWFREGRGSRVESVL